MITQNSATARVSFVGLGGRIKAGGGQVPLAPLPPLAVPKPPYWAPEQIIEYEKIYAAVRAADPCDQSYVSTAAIDPESINLAPGTYKIEGSITVGVDGLNGVGGGTLIGGNFSGYNPVLVPITNFEQLNSPYGLGPGPSGSWPGATNVMTSDILVGQLVSGVEGGGGYTGVTPLSTTLNPNQPVSRWGTPVEVGVTVWSNNWDLYAQREGASPIFDPSGLPGNIGDAMPAAWVNETFTDYYAPHTGWYPDCNTILDRQFDQWKSWSDRQYQVMRACNTEPEVKDPVPTGETLTANAFNAKYGGGTTSAETRTKIGNHIPSGEGSIRYQWTNTSVVTCRKYFWEVFDVYKRTADIYTLGEIVIHGEPEYIMWFTKGGLGVKNDPTTAATSWYGTPIGDNYYGPNLINGHYMNDSTTIVLTSPNGATMTISGTLHQEVVDTYEVLKGTKTSFETETYEYDWNYSEFWGIVRWLDIYKRNLYRNYDRIYRKEILKKDFPLLADKPGPVTPYPRPDPYTETQDYFVMLDALWLPFSPMQDKEYRDRMYGQQDYDPDNPYLNPSGPFGPDSKLKTWATSAGNLFSTAANAVSDWAASVNGAGYLSNGVWVPDVPWQTQGYFTPTWVEEKMGVIPAHLDSSGVLVPASIGLVPAHWEETWVSATTGGTPGHYDGDGKWVPGVSGGGGDTLTPDGYNATWYDDNVQAQSTYYVAAIAAYWAQINNLTATTTPPPVSSGPVPLTPEQLALSLLDLQTLLEQQQVVEIAYAEAEGVVRALQGTEIPPEVLLDAQERVRLLGVAMDEAYLVWMHSPSVYTQAAAKVARLKFDVATAALSVDTSIPPLDQSLAGDLEIALSVLANWRVILDDINSAVSTATQRINSNPSPSLRIQVGTSGTGISGGSSAVGGGVGTSSTEAKVSVSFTGKVIDTRSPPTPPPLTRYYPPLFPTDALKLPEPSPSNPDGTCPFG